jgi:hypothetical protein
MCRKAGLTLSLALSALACNAPRPAPNIADPDPQVKIAGIRQAAARGDRSVLPQLVDELDSDDPAVRLFAIEALQKFARERFGYEYYLDEERRKPSLARWRKWLKQQQQSQEPPRKDK